MTIAELDKALDAARVACFAAKDTAWFAYVAWDAARDDYVAAKDAYQDAYDKLKEKSK